MIKNKEEIINAIKTLKSIKDGKIFRAALILYDAIGLAESDLEHLSDNLITKVINTVDWFDSLYDDNVRESVEDVLSDSGEFDENGDYLPKEVVINIHSLVDDNIDLSGDDYNLDEVIADWLSDNYGFCVNGCDYNYDYNKDPEFVYVTNIDWDNE